MFNWEELSDPTIHLLGCVTVAQGKSHHIYNSGPTRGKGPHRVGVNTGLLWPHASFGEVGDVGASLVGIQGHQGG